MIPPLVSVLVRTYNRPDRLRRALDSICKQTYPNIEIVLVNDGGCELSELANEVKRFPMRYLAHEDNKGGGPAANTAIRNARGDYALFLDDDDTIQPQHIQELVDAATQNPSCGVIYSDSWMVSEGRTDEATNFSGTRKQIMTWEFSLADLLLRKSLPCINSALFRTDIAKELLFDETIKVGTDWDFWIRMALRTRFLHLRKATAEFREGSGRRPWREIAQGAMRVLSKYPNKTVEVPLTTFAYLLQQQIESAARIEELGGDGEGQSKSGPVLPMEESEMKIRFVKTEIKDQIRRGATAEAVVTLENCSKSILIGGCIGLSVRISYHWLDPTGRVIVWDGRRSFLPKLGLMPGERTTMLAAVEAPDAAGRYLLQFAALQEGVGWFPRAPNRINHLEQEIQVT